MFYVAAKTQGITRMLSQYPGKWFCFKSGCEVKDCKGSKQYRKCSYNSWRIHVGYTINIAKNLVFLKCAQVFTYIQFFAWNRHKCFK